MNPPFTFVFSCGRLEAESHHSNVNVVLTPPDLATCDTDKASWRRCRKQSHTDIIFYGRSNEIFRTLRLYQEEHDRVLWYLKCEAYVWRSSWQPDSGRAACVSRLCDTWSRCSAWYGTSLIRRCQICGTSDLWMHREQTMTACSMISTCSLSNDPELSRDLNGTSGKQSVNCKKGICGCT